MAAPLEKVRNNPGIYKRGSRYVFSYRVDGVQRWESCRTLEDARRAKQARSTDIARGEFQERSRVTLHHYLLGDPKDDEPGWIDRYHGRGSRGFREGTRDEYRRQLEQYVCRYFPARTKLTEISPSMVAKFVSWLCDPRKQAQLRHELAVERAEAEERPEPKPLADDAMYALSDATVQHIIAPLRAALATAVREGLIRSNPARDVDLPHRPTAEGSEEDDVKVLKRDELAMVLALVSERWSLFHWFLASTGLRISEAVALQWRHLVLDGATPHVKVRRALVKGRMGPPKSKHGRRQVPLDPELVQALRKHQKGSEWPEAEHLVFPVGNGSPIMPGNLRRRVLKPAAEEAGVPWVGFHTFRHTCASMLFAQGRNAVQVQRWLGHHSPAFTLATYVHLLDGDIGEPLSVSPKRLQSANNVQTDPTPLDDTQETVQPLERAA